MKSSFQKLGSLAVVALISSFALSLEAKATDAEILANRYCVKCHEIAPGVRPNQAILPSAPSFLVIANDPMTYPDADILAVLTAPHASMEPYVFTTAQAKSLLDYIHALSNKK